MIGSKRFKSKLLFVTGVVILCFRAFSNKYPLLTNNSGDYIAMPYIKALFHNSFYPVFIKYSSLNFSLWLSVFIQALFLATLLFYYSKALFQGIKYMQYYLVACFFITFFTMASVYVCSIDKNIFAGLTFLAGYLILFNSPSINRFQLFAIGLIFGIGLLVSTTYLICFIFSLLIYFVAYQFFKRWLSPISIYSVFTLLLFICLSGLMRVYADFAKEDEQTTAVYQDGSNTFSTRNISETNFTGLLTKIFDFDEIKFDQNTEPKSSALMGKMKVKSELRELDLSDQMTFGRNFVLVGKTQLFIVVFMTFFCLFYFREMDINQRKFISFFLILKIVSLCMVDDHTGIFNINWLITLPVLAHIMQKAYALKQTQQYEAGNIKA